MHKKTGRFGLIGINKVCTSTTQNQFATAYGASINIQIERHCQPRPPVLNKFHTASRSLFIRTITVGPGITPGLLTLSKRQFIDLFNKRSRARHIACHYRRRGISPRPENVYDYPWFYTQNNRSKNLSYLWNYCITGWVFG